MTTEAMNRITFLLGIALLALALAVIAPVAIQVALTALDEARRWLADLGPSLMPDLGIGGAQRP